MLSPRGQSGLEAKKAKILVSASKIWPWPQTFGLGLASISLSYYVIGHFSFKNRVKFRNFVNFFPAIILNRMLLIIIWYFFHNFLASALASTSRTWHRPRPRGFVWPRLTSLARRWAKHHESTRSRKNRSRKWTNCIDEVALWHLFQLLPSFSNKLIPHHRVADGKYSFWLRKHANRSTYRRGLRARTEDSVAENAALSVRVSTVGKGRGKGWGCYGDARTVIIIIDRRVRMFWNPVSASAHRHATTKWMNGAVEFISSQAGTGPGGPGGWRRPAAGLRRSTTAATHGPSTSGDEKHVVSTYH